MPTQRETSRGRRIRRGIVRIHVALSLYVMLYLPLSYFGEYQPASSGTKLYPGIVAVIDIAMWQPLGHANDVVRFMFTPLQWLDRAWWHHDQYGGDYQLMIEQMNPAAPPGPTNP